MNPHRSASRRFAAGAGVVVLLAAGCSGGSEADPPPGQTGDGSVPATAPPLVDRSATVLTGVVAPGVAATTPARADSSFEGSTFTIHSVVRTDTSTLLTFSVTPGAGSSARDQIATAWTGYPVLSTPTERYLVVVYEKDPGSSDPFAAVANPTLNVKAGTPTAPQTILYPPLPEGTASVSVSGDWFETVTVPVSSAP